MKFKLVKFKPKLTQIKGLECLNCGQPFVGNENFCSFCGQKNTIKKLNFGTFVNNLFSGFFSYDSRFWTTFIPLLTKPGKVSKDYIQGKRARFVNPFQLYLNVSIIFFLILGITNKLELDENIANNIVTASSNLDSIGQTGQRQLDSILKNAEDEIIKANPNDSTNTIVITDFGKLFKIKEYDTTQGNTVYNYHIKTDTVGRISILNRIEDFQHYYTKFPKYSSKQALDSLGYKQTFWNEFYYQEVINVNSNYNQIKSDGGKSYLKKLTSSISISLFVFLPVFTFFLMLLYIRRKYTYIEHLVFVFNTQTVFFLLLIIFYLIDFIVDLENVAWVFILLFLLYLYKALRNFYEQRRFKTIIKYILLNSFYMILAIIGLIIVAAISFVSN